MESLWGTVEGLWSGVIEALTHVVTPDWAALIGLLPVGILLGVVVFFAWIVVRYATAAPTRRGPGKLPPVTPAGIHMPGPSLAPVYAAAGLFLLFFGLVSGVGSTWFWIGLATFVATLLFWLREGMRDYDAIEAPAALVVAYGNAPDGIHMPGPSFHPLLVSASLVVLFAGFLLGPALLVGGVVLVFVTLVGWLRDAGREYHATAAADTTGHREADPSPAIPRGTLVAFIVVVLVGGALTLPGGGAAAGGGDASGGTSGGASPSAGASSGGGNGGASGSPAASALAGDLTIHAMNVQFDTASLEGPAGKDFTIAFHNDDAGVPHNVAIHEGSPTGKELWKGEIVNGVTAVLYTVPALPAGTYGFVCTVHPNMAGTLTLK